MKTIKSTQLVLAILMTLCFTSIKADKAPVLKKSESETQKTIRHYLKFPNVLMPSMEVRNKAFTKVEVLFTTDSTGRVNFVFARTDDKALKREIEGQFLNMPLRSIRQSVVHSVIINFRVI